jgi:uncharacterized UBP type Zn finger protein
MPKLSEKTGEEVKANLDSEQVKCKEMLKGWEAEAGECDDPENFPLNSGKMDEGNFSVCKYCDEAEN